MTLFVKKIINFIIIYTAFMTLSLGCSVEPEATFVDFSVKTAVKQPADVDNNAAIFNVAVGSMVSAEETTVYYHQLLGYIAEKLGRKIRLIQRNTYGEINRLISMGQVDLAFICSGPYANGRKIFGFEAVAMPLIRGSHLYRSYLIVNKTSPFQKLRDLKGKIFAFTDPDSNTGRLVPLFWLRKEGENPEDFFSKAIYTHSHDNSIMAVAMSLVDGGAVHGQIWEYYKDRNTLFSSKTRIIKKSRPFGNPPVVVSSRMPDEMKERIRNLFLNLHLDPKGNKILHELMIDRFITPIEESYAPILAMKKYLQ